MKVYISLLGHDGIALYLSCGGIFKLGIVAGGAGAGQSCRLVPGRAIVRVVFVHNVAGQCAGLRHIAHQRGNGAAVTLDANLSLKGLNIRTSYY